MIINLPQTLGPCKDFPTMREYLINLFNPDDRLLRTPGVDLWTNGSGLTRGGAVHLGEAYLISGTRFCRLEEDGVVTNIGALITGQTSFELAPSFNEMAICEVSDTGRGFVYDAAADTLTEITDAAWVSSRDVCTIEGLAVWCPYDGSPIFYSDQNDFLNYSPLKYFDAEQLPDKNRGVINVRNNLFVLGEESIEQFRTTPDTNIRFVSVAQGQVMVGYLAGKTLYKNTFAFLGKKQSDAYGFFAFGQGDAPKISSEFVDEILNNEYALEELETCRAFRYVWKGHEIICFNLPRHTFAYQNDRWSLMESQFNGPSFQSRWRANLMLHCYGFYIVGDLESSAIGKLSDGNMEFGGGIEREFTTFIKVERDADFTVKELTLDCLAGQQLTGGQIGGVGLRMSEDGYSYFNEYFRSLGETGKYKQTVNWCLPGGLGSYESFAGMRFRVTANVDFAANSVQVEI
jgi:hypothetical protein